MNYFLVLNLFFECFYTGKILSIRFLLTHPVYMFLTPADISHKLENLGHSHQLL